MRVLVTGASGFIGSAIVRRLLDDGDEVFAACRGATPRRAATAARRVTADFTTAEGRSSLAAVRPELCIHSAWYAEPGKYLNSVANIEMMNSSILLAKSLALAGCGQFTGLGTCAEYDLERGYLHEDTPLSPRHLYSAAKAGTYMTTRELGRQMRFRFTWARIFYLYGPGEDPRRLVPSIVRALLEGRPAEASAGTQIRDFLHVDDVAAGVVAAAKAGVDDAVNVSSGQPISVAQMVTSLGRLLGREDLLRLGARAQPEGDPAFVCGDNRRLAATGWTPRFGLEQGLGETIDWWRRQSAALRSES